SALPHPRCASSLPTRTHVCHTDGLQLETRNPELETLSAPPQVAAAQTAPPRRALGTNLPTLVIESSDDLATHVAQVVAGIVRDRCRQGQRAVLGLPTGSTPVGVYQELVRMHREEGLDFSHVVAFVLNEFFSLHPDQLQSHHRWIKEHLLDHVNIPPE